MKWPIWPRVLTRGSVWVLMASSFQKTPVAVAAIAARAWLVSYHAQWVRRIRACAVPSSVVRRKLRPRHHPERRSDGDRAWDVGRLGSSSAHPYLHPMAIKQILPDEGVVRHQPLGLLSALTLEGDQPSRPVHGSAESF